MLFFFGVWGFIRLEVFRWVIDESLVRALFEIGLPRKNTDATIVQTAIKILTRYFDHR